MVPFVLLSVSLFFPNDKKDKKDKRAKWSWKMYDLLQSLGALRPLRETFSEISRKER